MHPDERDLEILFALNPKGRAGAVRRLSATPFAEPMLRHDSGNCFTAERTKGLVRTFFQSLTINEPVFFPVGEFLFAPTIPSLRVQP